MTFDEFKKAAEDMCGSGAWRVRQATGTEELFSVQWSTGGKHGASCWDEGPPDFYEVDGEREPDSWQLTDFLIKYYPSIGFLQFNKLVKDCVKVVEDSDIDYYGNTDDYAIKYALYKDVYNSLKEMGYED